MPFPYEGLTADFVREPLNFMRKHAMSPPDDFGRQGNLVTGIKDVGDRVLGSNVSSEFDRLTATVNRKTGGAAVRVQIITHPTVNFPGAVSLKVLPVLTSTGQANAVDAKFVPIHWLPWQSLSILQYRIPEVPSNVVDPQDDEYPRFFFTAGINGCSIFAHGSPTSPFLSHAGVSGATIKGSAGDFWRKQMAQTKSAFANSNVAGEVNTHEYMYTGVAPDERMLIKDYEHWLAGTDLSRFKVEVLSPFGCVFGIRYGRYWSLYLQKNAIFETVSFYRQSEVDDDGKLKSTGAQTTFEKSRAMFEPRKLGPITLGKKKVKVYSTSTLHALPMELVEFYPNRAFVANLKTTFKRAGA